MIIALIPARSGSKGLTNKNIKELGGFSLLEWSIKACQKSKLIDRIYVSTDSEEYRDLAIKAGAEVPFLRPKILSKDDSTDIEFINHALCWMEINNLFPEIFVHIRPTTPFRNPLIIDQAIRSFKSCPSATSLRSVHKMSESAYKTFEIGNKKFLKCTFTDEYNVDINNGPRQAFPDTFYPNGYVDVLSTKFIKNNNKLHGSNCLSFITEFSIEVDTKEDFDLLEFKLVQNPDLINLFND